MLYENLLPRKVLELSAGGCGAVTLASNSQIHKAATFMGGGTVSTGKVFISGLMTICQISLQKDIQKDKITRPIFSYKLRQFRLKATTFIINLSVTVLPMTSFSI
jgi:hypothetical protein